MYRKERDGVQGEEQSLPERPSHSLGTVASLSEGGPLEHLIVALVAEWSHWTDL